MDALRQTHPDADSVRLADISLNGATVHLNDRLANIAPMRQAAVARLRTSRRLAGCLETEPIDGLFDETTGINFKRRRRRSRWPSEVTGARAANGRGGCWTTTRRRGTRNRPAASPA